MNKKYLCRTFVLLGLAALSFIVIMALHTRVATDAVPLIDDYSSSVPPPSDGDRYKWRADSPITFINYFSLDCPHCRELSLLEDERRQWYENTFSLVYRHSPLPAIQPLSGEKAVLAECVRVLQGDVSFFAFIAKLFEEYPLRHSDNGWVRSLAKEFVSNEKAYNECVIMEGEQIIDQAHNEALAHEVYGTPTIVVFDGKTEILRLNKTNAETVLRIMDSIRKSP